MDWNRTKVVATIGPASSQEKVLLSMLAAGVDVIRINGAHGDPAEHARGVRLVRGLAKKMGLHVAILFDLPGPKLRIGELAAGTAQLKRGQRVVLICGRIKQSDSKIPVPERMVAKIVRKGSRIFLNDGIVELKVERISGVDVECIVAAGGEIRSRKGMNIPRVSRPVPAITNADLKLIRHAVKMGVDFIGLSFVQRMADVKKLRRILKDLKADDISIVAKIEKPEALDDLDNIVAVSDAVMVARGDLGIEVEFDKLPAIQRDVIALCRRMRKPVIVATQMLESMVDAARPTRAEVTDVASAVWNGADAVMLSEETSIGKDPRRAVLAMVKIAREAENSPIADIVHPFESDPLKMRAQTLAESSALIACELGIDTIVVATKAGRMPSYVSSVRPNASIIAATSNDGMARRLNLLWGVYPVIVKKFRGIDEILKASESAIKKHNRMVGRNNSAIIISGAYGSDDEIAKMIEIRTTGVF